MRIFLPILLLLAVFLHSCTSTPAPASAEKLVLKTNKKFDLVLIHGLANMHKWSNSFLEACLEIWGSGRVFVVYTSTETTVTERNMKGRILIAGGGDGGKAGIDPIDKQVANTTKILQILQDKYRLQAPFSIIAHSMGGLVARQYIYQNPGKVAGLVTLGTPHQGSPLAESFQWIGHFLNAAAAIENLKPNNIEQFNERYPAENTPLAFNNKIYLIRGVPDGTDCFGWAGELFLGWQILSAVYDTESDGLVPYHSAVIKGAVHIADFPHYDHYDLVRQPDVAKTAAKYLP